MHASFAYVRKYILHAELKQMMQKNNATIVKLPFTPLVRMLLTGAHQSVSNSTVVLFK